MTAITKGSLSALANGANVGLAEAFMSADTIIIVDTSGSMDSRDGDGFTRYERACSELRQLQANLSGRIAVISFSSGVQFDPGGVPTFHGGGTNMAEALRYVHIADGLVDRFILISDGEPDSAQDALVEAKKFTTRIDTIYIGAEGGHGAAFLKKLAAASGGTAQSIKQAGLLAEKIEVLMLTA
jgi:hypothetical protein